MQSLPLERRGARVDVHVVETEGGTAELGKDWRNERMVDEVPVDLVPVECVLIVLDALRLLALTQPLHLIGLGQEGGDGVGGEGAADDNVLRRRQRQG